MDIKSYKKDFEYSYTLGAFPTFELIEAMPDQVLEVFVHSTFTDREKLERKCAERGIRVTQNDKLINKLSDKENVFVIGVFKKFEQKLDTTRPHIVLVNPSNMGNMGTIIRTAVGFGVFDLAIISPGVDIYNPKVVRASMGSLFRLHHQYFESFEEYKKTFVTEGRDIFTFMLNANKQLTIDDCPKTELFSLVFGNEATGLPDSFLNEGQSIIIPQTEFVDSLNLALAVGVGIFTFMQNLRK